MHVQTEVDEAGAQDCYLNLSVGPMKIFRACFNHLTPSLLASVSTVVRVPMVH